MWKCRNNRLALIMAAVFFVMFFMRPAALHCEKSVQRNTIPAPEKFFGHPIGADRKLVNWKRAAAYFQQLDRLSNRVKVTEIGKTTHNRPFLLIQVSSEKNISKLDKYKALQQRLYFQDHKPGRDPYSLHSQAQQKEIFGTGKAVVVITCSMHATEVGAAQMSLELVYRLATETTPKIINILNNVILLLVPNLNPDGQDMIADWYMQHVGTPQEGGSMPWLYHPYTGHDNNRDAYMFTQQETHLLGKVLYEEWFPCIWVDMHQMGSSGARMFVMPATDPININVHPLIYRLNGLFGHAQGAALEAQGKTGVIYNSTYTNYWEGAMGWMGWWHNQVGMLTEAASVRIATPIEQKLAVLGTPPGPRLSRAERRRLMMAGGPLPAPRDVQPRTNYPRPWLGGKWTLRDIVDYDHIVAVAVLETAAGIRRQLLEQIYHVNQSTIASFLQGQSGIKAEGYPPVPKGIKSGHSQMGRVMPGSTGAAGSPYAIVIPADQCDPPTVIKMVKTLEKGGIVIEQAKSEFLAGGKQYPAGTYVIRLAQVFGRYAKDMLEPQAYPEVRRHPSLPAEPPYDVSGWSLGMQMGVEVRFIEKPFTADLVSVRGKNLLTGHLQGQGDVFLVSAAYNDGFKLVNHLFDKKAEIRRARAAFKAAVPGSEKEQSYPAGSWIISNIASQEMDSLAQRWGLVITAVAKPPEVAQIHVKKPRIGLYQPWSSNADEGWTRWVLEQFGFEFTVLHAQDLKAAGVGTDKDYEISAEIRAEWPLHVSRHAPKQVSADPLSYRFDVIVLAHQQAESIIRGSNSASIPAVYRGGIGEEGIKALKDFVKSGGSLVALGDATDFLIQEWPLPIKNSVSGLDSEKFLIPGSVVRIQSDPGHPLSWGMPDTSYGYFRRNPVFTLMEGFGGQALSIPVRYPNNRVRASGWVRGGEYIAGLPAVVQVDFNSQSGQPGGHLVLLGLRVQNRAQTHGTFKLFFNSIMPGK